MGEINEFDRMFISFGAVRNQSTNLVTNADIIRHIESLKGEGNVTLEDIDKVLHYLDEHYEVIDQAIQNAVEHVIEPISDLSKQHEGRTPISSGE